MTILSILYLKLSISILNIKLSLKMVQLAEGYKERIIALSNIGYYSDEPTVALRSTRRRFE